jgi:mannose-6-phosphate isomerase-like protein (cupin superfamily)
MSKFKVCNLLLLISAGTFFLSCCGNACKSAKSCEKSCDSTKLECPAKPVIDLTNAKLFFEYDSTAAIDVKENVTRKFTYLNDLMVVIVDFYNGPMSEPDPPHSHLAEQITYIAEGEALVIIGDKQQRLKAGDMFAVPSNVPHTVQSLSKTLKLVDSFNPIREDFIQ